MTTQNPNGNEPSSIAESRLSELQTLTAQYMEGLKLNIKTPNQAESWLNLEEERLSLMTAEECAETAFKLSQYGLFIQKEINRHKAVFSWAESSIVKIIATRLNDYGTQYTPYLIKRAMAIKENPMATELEKIQVLTNNNLLSLEEMPRRIESMVQSLKELSMVRRKQ